MRTLAKILQHRFLTNNNGQSAVEYIVVCAALVAGLIITPNIYDTISHTMQDKYKSYAFSVSISDPPSKQFDDKVKHDADEVKHVIDILKDLEKLVTDSIIPDILHGKIPSEDSVKEFLHLLKSLF
jgi:Flp pilus assembly pilin Flp